MRDLNGVLCAGASREIYRGLSSDTLLTWKKNFKICPASNTRILSSEPLNLKQENGMIIFCEFHLCHFWSDPWHVLWLIFMKVPATQELSSIPGDLMTIINKIIIIISYTEMYLTVKSSKTETGSCLPMFSQCQAHSSFSLINMQMN